MKQKANAKIAAKTLPPVTLVPAEAGFHQARKRDQVTSTPEFKTLAEQVAKSSVVMKNWYIDELREKYRHFDRMKRVDKVFPYAKLSENADPCMILIDEPRSEYEVDICYQKAKIVRGLGYKYAVIEDDSTLFDVLEQLGAV